MAREFWQRKDRHYWQRGEYRVSVAFIGPNGTRARFSAWGPKLPPPPELADPKRPSYGSRVNPLGCFDPLQEAQARCEANQAAEGRPIAREAK